MTVHAMIRPIVYIVLTFLGVHGLYAQELVKSPLGFAMEKPPGWISTNDEKMAESLKNIELSDDVLDKLLKSRNNSLQVLAFQKYRAEEREGPIPTIQVRMRPNPIPDFDTFMAAFLRSIDPSKMPFQNYKILAKETYMVSGLKAVKVFSTYSIGSDNTRALTYVVPVRKQYFQITFIDMPPGEDCSTLFDNLVNTIKIEHGNTKAS
jgi:hypothetical protein